ncbi:MAG: SDR family oxidoreductase [Gammaproteobacteria bacterium]|nr:SDR family oxidoreductase [Gammaproteobacteria bacterium]
MKQGEKRAKSAARQHRQPGREHSLEPRPLIIRDSYRGSGKLEGKVAIISGGDSGIGRAVAVHFAREGARSALIYLEEDKDAEETRSLVEAEGVDCLLLQGDVGDHAFCRSAVERTMDKFERLDILINNAAEQHPTEKFEDIEPEQIERTFRTNIFGYFFLAQAALPHLGEGSSILNTSSVTAYRGSPHLLDYSATKGAISAFTSSLSLALVERGIRVNGVAPGPIWTPLIAATFEPDHARDFGKDTPMGRPGQPAEVAPAYVFLASEDASYMTGQIVHLDGGKFVHT